MRTNIAQARACSEMLDKAIANGANRSLTTAQIIVELGTSETHHLLESLAGRMLDTLAAKFPRAGFRIEVRKLNPPACPGHPAYAAVRMDRAAGEK